LAGPLIQARADANPQVTWRGTVAQRQTGLLTLRGATPRGSLSPRMWEPRSAPRLDLPPGFGRLELTPAAHGPIDLDSLPAQLTVRPRRGGERLRPRRGGPERTLKSLLQGGRIAQSERERVPLLFDGDRLLAVADLWIDAQVQAGPATRRRARLTWHRSVR
jgi:tRNA(Ile)-lysidine synthase